MAILFILCIAFFVVCVLCGIWRVNLAINHPEKEARLREYQAHVRKENEEAIKKLASGAKEVIDFGLKHRGKFMK